MDIRNDAPDGQVSRDFLQGMVTRMATSYHKYGHIKINYPDTMDAVAMLRDRLDMYLKTGNLEWLMDVANYAMIEFMLPNASRFPPHNPPHFRATSAEESPGRISNKGTREMWTLDDLKED